MVAGPSLVQSEHLTRGVVELVMVDLDVRKRCIELHVDVALPGRELERRHSGGAWAGFLMLWSMVWYGMVWYATWYMVLYVQGDSGGRHGSHRESQGAVLVTKQCTWDLSGTVGLVVGVFELRQLSSLDPRPAAQVGQRLYAFLQPRRARDTLNSLLPASKPVDVLEACFALVNMLIGLCGGKHPVGQTRQRLTPTRNLRRQVVDSFIPHRGAWLQASPSSPHRCHARRRKVSV